MITNALSSSVSGLMAASQATSAHANNVANVTTEDYQAQQPVKQSTGNGVSMSLKPGPGAGVELSQEMTGLLIEEQAFSANASVIRTVDDMTQELLDIVK